MLSLFLSTQFFPFILGMLNYLPQLLMRPCDKDLLVEGVMNSFESLTKSILCYYNMVNEKRIFAWASFNFYNLAF